MAGPNNICVPLFKGGDADTSVRATAPVVGKTFGAISATIQSGPDITTAVLPATYDGGNLQAATAAAGAKADGVFAYDAATGVLLPLIGSGNVVPVTCDGAVTAGQEVEVGTAGRAKTLGTGKAVGKANTTGVNAGDAYIELY